ncbi:MAG: tRNA (adenosine(37)-N6)-threonylcarbamoyltransferase complex ATPase subunit type 1 TsaE [Firmicutes bacterium]|nr:tRNA (adenosine(37)-N6)-threonylcarbamoyltransferase complex ATPase subunit type 1 TsaE [Bacillota bacterium]
MLVYRAFSPRDTRRLGEALGKLLDPGDVVCIEGQLGAGKTVFVQGVAAGMGVRGRVVSPTFTIIHEHPGKIPLYHIDAYRLEGVPDAESAGVEECLYGAGAVAIEWPERIRELLPEERLDVEIRMPIDDGIDDGGGGRGTSGKGKRDGESLDDDEGDGDGDGDGHSDGDVSGAREIVLFPRGDRFRRMVEELKALAGPGY